MKPTDVQPGRLGSNVHIAGEHHHVGFMIALSMGFMKPFLKKKTGIFVDGFQCGESSPAMVASSGLVNYFNLVHDVSWKMMN